MSIIQAAIQAYILGLAKNPVVITGTLGAGNVLTASLRPGYTSTGLQWTKNGTDIAGQTTSQYTQQQGDRGAVIGCRAIGLSYAGSAGTVPFTAPLAPTITTITTGNASLTVAFSAPSEDGGSAITGYTAYVYRALDNVQVGKVSRAAGPIVVSGLVNDTAVYAKVTASNAIGEGAASAASPTATPTFYAAITYKLQTLTLVLPASYYPSRILAANSRRIWAKVVNISGENVVAGVTTNDNSNVNAPGTYPYTLTPSGAAQELYTDVPGQQIYAVPSVKRTITGITSSGTTATINAPGHGLTTGRSIITEGNVPTGYNLNSRAITVIDADNFTYPLAAAQAAVTTTGTYSMADNQVQIIEASTVA